MGRYQSHWRKRSEEVNTKYQIPSSYEGVQHHGIFQILFAAIGTTNLWCARTVGIQCDYAPAQCLFFNVSVYFCISLRILRLQWKLDERKNPKKKNMRNKFALVSASFDGCLSARQLANCLPNLLAFQFSPSIYFLLFLLFSIFTISVVFRAWGI